MPAEEAKCYPFGLRIKNFANTTVLRSINFFSAVVSPKYFSHREFSFTLKDDIYIRYQSFSDQKDMEKEIQKRCPYKIDIGAVFSQKVQCVYLKCY